MNYASGWDFTLANYDAVWGFLVQMGLLLLFLMLGNILRRTIPLFRKCLIPSALLGGTMLLLVNIVSKQLGFRPVDNRLMQVITYHCLAIGFAAMTLKTEKKAQQRAYSILKSNRMATEEELADLKELFRLYNIQYVNDIILACLELLYTILQIALAASDVDLKK